MSKRGEGIGKLIDDYAKRYGHPPGSPIVQSMVDGISKIFTGSFRTPPDAATARTPESEEREMIPLVIPPQYEVNRLIEEARALEAQAHAGGLNIGPEERSLRLSQATAARMKALALHVGIEGP